MLYIYRRVTDLICMRRTIFTYICIHTTETRGGFSSRLLCCRDNTRRYRLSARFSRVFLVTGQCADAGRVAGSGARTKGLPSPPLQGHTAYLDMLIRSWRDEPHAKYVAVMTNYYNIKRARRPGKTTRPCTRDRYIGHSLQLKNATRTLSFLFFFLFDTLFGLPRACKPYNGKEYRVHCSLFALRTAGRRENDNVSRVLCMFDRPIMRVVYAARKRKSFFAPSGRVYNRQHRSSEKLAGQLLVYIIVIRHVFFFTKNMPFCQLKFV